MKKNMGRPREFNPEDFLMSALEVFWSKGFHATSMNDLMTVSNLASASIYRLFPDKKSIFLAALSKYMEDGLKRMESRAYKLPPEQALRETLDYCAVLSTGEIGVRGCFTIRAASELLPDDKAVYDKVSYMFNGIKSNLLHILTLGQKNNIFRTDTNAEVMAESIFMMLEGMRLYGKVAPDLMSLKRTNAFILQSVLKPDQCPTLVSEGGG